MAGISGGELRRLRWLHWLNRLRWSMGAVAGNELHYQLVFDAAVARSGIAVPPLYPVGSAANAGLLYVLFRLLEAFPDLDILELGAGQSTLLLDALAKAGRARSVLTLEHDPRWRDSVQAKVGHEVRLALLKEASVLGVATQAYETTLDGRFNCVIVDGPPGKPRYSRWGTLELLQQHLADEFIVIFDDGERPGERDTLEKFCTLHPEAAHHFVHAAKSQCLVYTPRFASLQAY